MEHEPHHVEDDPISAALRDILLDYARVRDDRRSLVGIAKRLTFVTGELWDKIMGVVG
jgi:hypothetical protein